MRNVLKDRPYLTLTQLERTRRLMDEHGGDCLVSGYEKHIKRLTLPDMDDCHVLAAAIECEAIAVVTWNLDDFPASVVKEHGIKVWSPDELLVELLASNQDLVIQAMHEHRASLKNPPKTADEYLETLAQQRLTKTIQIIRSLNDPI